jgi:apolipoprotein N-acyltransferase
LLDPADDWRAIDPVHTRMASFRAIEQGVNLVRQTSNGRSAAYDFQGHVLAEGDDFRSPDGVMVVQLPVRGVRTLYSRVGDWLAWLCLGTLLWAAFRAARRPDSPRAAVQR